MIKPELFILFVHTLASIVYAIFFFSGKSCLRKEYLILIFLLPLAGPVIAATIEIYNYLGKQGTASLDLVPLTLDDDILWKTLKSFSEEGNLVPLEEAMLVNDFRTRRKLMLDVLYSNPMKYLDVLMIARHNDDIETTHYATTTIAHIQKRFQLSIQELAIAIEKYPENEILLDEYIATLEDYIESGLLEEYLLRNQRLAYAQSLDKKLRKNPGDKEILIKKLRNSLELRDYFAAFEMSEALKQHYKEDELTWIETIRACVDGKDQKRLKETLQEIQRTEIDWTQQGKDAIAIWLEGAKA